MSYINLLEVIYPVNSLYFSYSDVSPAAMVGGTWEQIVDKVVRAGNDTNAAGADNTTLAVANLPAHSHTITVSNAVCDTQETWANVLGSFCVAMSWTHGATADPANKGATTTRATSSIGSTQAFSNLPAYQNVYVWRRTN